MLRYHYVENGLTDLLGISIKLLNFSKLYLTTTGIIIQRLKTIKEFLYTNINEKSIVDVTTNKQTLDVNISTLRNCQKKPFVICLLKENDLFILIVQTQNCLEQLQAWRVLNLLWKLQNPLFVN